jgi:hypothetical protein
VLHRFDADFASDARNVCFRLVTDGFDPFSTNSAPYSCWPIFVVSYNLPPSLCIKFEFMFLCLIVPGPEAPGPRINVMLKSLIEELKQLWIGVEAYDCYKKKKINLHVELTCPICGSDIDCFRLTHGGKISCFDCRRHWLPRKHKFRQQQNTFKKGNIVTKGPLKRLSDQQIIDMLDKLTPGPKRPGYFEGYRETHNWTSKCALWELSYMSVLILMHNIDVMHQECNMGESIISTCMGFPGKMKDNMRLKRIWQSFVTIHLLSSK